MPGLRAAIAAMTRDRVIGLDGDLPWHYSEDLKHFKRVTSGHTIIMGRLTWQSLGGKPLPNRRNIVISSRQLDRVETFRSLTTALDSCERQDVWLVGGAGIYAEGMSYCDLLDITLVPDIIDQAHAVKFPSIDPAHWQVESSSPYDRAPQLTHVVYRRRGTKSLFRYCRDCSQ